ncbi:unnamed protein product [Onchocerca flexuosa]|uniref:Transposase n=1 Tax=Onchocerca flexuosa TaxID=387005 RepID=A0A183H4T0_9BILA|nr:unnamed protein product [Onchocerca flexuosa]
MSGYSGDHNGTNQIIRNSTKSLLFRKRGLLGLDPNNYLIADQLNYYLDDRHIELGENGLALCKVVIHQ